WLYHRVGPRAQTLIILIVLLPLLTSVVVRTFAWIVILGRQGIINSTLLSISAIDTPIRLLYTQVGVVLALAQVQMPLMTLPLITALGRIDMNFEDASCALGAGSWRTFWKVVLPLSLPGVIAGCTLTYAAAITASSHSPLSAADKCCSCRCIFISRPRPCRTGRLPPRSRSSFFSRF